MEADSEGRKLFTEGTLTNKISMKPTVEEKPVEDKPGEDKPEKPDTE